MRKAKPVIGALWKSEQQSLILLFFGAGSGNAAVHLHEVDGHTFSAKSPRAANSVDVKLPVVGQVVANHQGDLRK